LHIVLENIVPSSLNRSFLSKGLQHASALVQHMTATVLIKCLTKLELVVGKMFQISVTLQEDQERGLWLNRAKAVEQEARKRLPDYRLIVNFAQHSQTITLLDESKTVAEDSTAKAKTPAKPRDSDTLDVLSEAALRLLSLYHRCVPDAASEVKFDTGKLLALLDESPSSSDVANGFGRLRQLHILRLLKDDPQFVWSNKASTFAQSMRTAY
jgi:nucleolar pre-ribosomal-associated protein 1